MEKVLRTENLEQGHTESVTGLNEAADEVDLALVAEQLPWLHADGKLHLRTCKEGDELREAEAAKWEKARASSEKQGLEGVDVE